MPDPLDVISAGGLGPPHPPPKPPPAPRVNLFPNAPVARQGGQPAPQTGPDTSQLTEVFRLFRAALACRHDPVTMKAHFNQAQTELDRIALQNGHEGLIVRKLRPPIRAQHKAMVNAKRPAAEQIAVVAKAWISQSEEE